MNYTILIVDDHEAIRHTLRAIFETKSKGEWTVVDAADGVEALAILQNQVPNIVITDLMLPRLSGIELVAEVKKLHPELPVVVLSAKFEPEKELAPEQVAMVKAFLPKPIDAEELFQKIKQELELVAPPY